MSFPRLDPTHGAVHAAVEIAAPPERVFRALTDPDELAAWWGSADTYRTHDWRVDARPGGEWSARATGPDGRDATVAGEYVSVDPPHLIEHTWRASWDAGPPTTVRYELAPAVVDGVPGTRLTVTHTGLTGFAGAALATGVAPTHGWAALVARLAAHVALTSHVTPRRRAAPVRTARAGRWS